MEVESENADSEIRGGRSQEDVLSVLEYAKLQACDLRSRTQCIVFSNTLDNERFKLLELDPSVLDSVMAGDRVVIRGDKDDSAVLCTRDKTYEMKEAETSNSLLILPHLEHGPDLPTDTPHELQYREVISVLDKYFELRPCKPRLRKLKALLQENQYSGRECEEDEDHRGRKYTYHELLEKVQASEEEVAAALKSFKACLIDGHWRMLDFDFLMQVLNHILQLCEEHDWLMTGVNMTECCDTLQDLYPRHLVEHVVQCYTDPRTSQGDNTDTVYVLNEDKICRFFAELTLRNSGKFHYDEFLQVWQQCVPAGMHTGLYQIEGMALIDEDSVPPVIWYFTAEDLPEDTAERFEYLFQTRKKWTREEITPYIKDVATDKVDVGALLTKYARASLQNGIKVFSSRKISA
ncbi:sister chromatid cohesion protein DCC1-like isoform X1 [Haliotis rufescens]|uniref:sister chromatid cohesion protein DCC1-like isoform X1 n=1 Tax=Haliotis rufescens TaxID=6454 RepID=UPI00201EDD48|nr:sister chromatid cohesion protein DCC1-like isoform X1 [Haliotis rufescens]